MVGFLARFKRLKKPHCFNRVGKTLLYPHIPRNFWTSKKQLIKSFLFFFWIRIDSLDSTECKTHDCCYKFVGLYKAMWFLIVVCRWLMVFTYGWTQITWRDDFAWNSWYHPIRRDCWFSKNLNKKPKKIVDQSPHKKITTLLVKRSYSPHWGVYLEWVLSMYVTPPTARHLLRCSNYYAKTWYVE